MTNEIVKINASDYGIEETKAAEIEAMFLPMLSKMKELEKEFNNILKLPIEPETCKMAKDLRLAYVKTRTGTDEIHQKLKAFYLSGGRFVDAFKNTQAFASGEKESILKQIENHYEILEAEKKARLKEERTAKILPYMAEVNTFLLGEMTEEVWLWFFAGAKLEYETRVAAEKKAEENRIAKEKADAEARELQRLENIRLIAEMKEKEREMEEKERLAEIERKKQAAALAYQKAKADKERAELLAKAEKEKEERERIVRQMEEQSAKIEKARKDTELQKQAEQKAKAQSEKKAKLAPDKNKLLAFGQALNDIPRPEIKSVEAASIMANINGLLVKLLNYIKEEANKL